MTIDTGHITVEAVTQFAGRQAEVWNQAQNALKKAQEAMSLQYDKRKKTSILYKRDDLVYINAEHLLMV